MAYSFGSDDRMDGIQDDEDVAPFVPLHGLPPGRSIGVVWGPGNRIATFGTDFLLNDKRSKIRDRRAGNVCLASWERSIGARRKLICESFGPFSALQIAMRQIPPTEHRSRTRPLLSACHHYRTFARQMTLTVREKQDDLKSSAVVQQTLSSAFIMEVTLHLAEMFFLVPMSYAQPSFFDWLEWHFPLDPELHDQFTEVARPETTKQYWDAVYQLVLRGKLEEARQLLELHSEGGPAFFGVIKGDIYDGEDDHKHMFQAFCAQVGEILHRMPLLRGASLIADHMASWQSWRELINRVASKFNDTVREHPQLNRLLRILRGDMNEINACARDWKELLMASLLFINPDVKTSELANVYQECIQSKTNDDEDDVVAALYDAAFTSNLNDFVRQVYEIGDLWLTAHVLDLLHHRDALAPRELPEHGITQRQHALLDYAYAIATDEVSPQIFVEYILESDVAHANDLVEQLLFRFVPVRSDRDARKLTALVDKLNMDEVYKRRIVQRINKIVSRSFISRGLVGPAISWAAGAGGSDNVAQNLSDRLLDELILPLSQIDVAHHMNLARVVDSLGLNHIMSRFIGLQFLRLYRDICQSWLENDLHEVATLLITAITQAICPRKFWLLLLKDCTSLIEKLPTRLLSPTSFALFTAHQILDLMRCLEEVYLSHEREQYLSGFQQILKKFQPDGASDADVEVEVEEMRRVLTNALGSALMASGPHASMAVEQSIM